MQFIMRYGWMLPMFIVMLLPILTMFAMYPSLARMVKSARMKLTSPAFNHAEAIPSQFTSDGEDTNPPLLIGGVPDDAKSLALVMEDPDAADAPGGAWIHWLLWNIAPATLQIEPAGLPAGAEQGANSWERRNYRGPCTPTGTHRYFFRLYALKERLDLPSTSTRDDLDRAMQGKILAQTELLGIYSRK